MAHICQSISLSSRNIRSIFGGSLIAYCTWFFLLVSTVAQAQRESELNMVSFMESKPGLEAGIAYFQTLYAFRNGDKIESVGAGRVSREVIYSMMADSLTMYLQDIDSSMLTSQWIIQLTERQYKIAERRVTASFVLVNGTENETRLPKSTFDKVILEHGLHEFTQQNKMMTDIRATLKPDGQLFVWELMAKKPGRKHRFCKKPMLTEQQLIEMMDRAGFRLTKSVRVFRDVPKGKLYTFLLAE